LHVSQRDVAVVFLARGFVEELVEEEEGQNIGVVQ
jgi:hypothetical protein